MSQTQNKPNQQGQSNQGSKSPSQGQANQNKNKGSSSEEQNAGTWSAGSSKGANTPEIPNRSVPEKQVPASAN